MPWRSPMKLLVYLGISAVIYWGYKRYKRFGHLEPLTLKAQQILFKRFGEPMGFVNANTFMNFFAEFEEPMRIPILQVSAMRCLISPGTAVMAAKRYSLRVSIKIRKNTLWVKRALYKQSLPDEKDFSKLVPPKRVHNFNSYKTRSKTIKKAS